MEEWDIVPGLLRTGSGISFFNWGYKVDRWSRRNKSIPRENKVLVKQWIISKFGKM